MSNFKAFCDSLEKKIQDSYEGGITAENAEKLAGEFLFAQMRVSAELTKTDLDSRMKKSAVKAIKAAIYMETATRGEKKPTEAMIAATVDSHEVVQAEQDNLDRAEVSRGELERLYNVFQHAHVFYRGVAKGQFGG